MQHLIYINNGYSFWDLLKFIFNSVIKISMLIKITFKWALDDSKVKNKGTEHAQLNMQEYFKIKHDFIWVVNAVNIVLQRSRMKMKQYLTRHAEM